MIGKIAKWFVGILSVVLLLIYVSLEGVYFYGLRVLPEDTKPTKKTYSQKLSRIQWIAAEGSRQIKLTPLSPLKYVITLSGIGDYIRKSKSNHRLPAGLRLASQNARELLSRENNPQVRKNWQLNWMSATIWISNHWTATEAINNLLANSYYGHGFTGIESAAMGYFNKPYQELDTYEIALLVGVQKAPSAYSPWCSPNRAVMRMNYVINKLSQTWPSVYGNLSEVKEVPSGLVRYEEECNT